jgi:hypothetical protein
MAGRGGGPPRVLARQRRVRRGAASRNRRRARRLELRASARLRRGDLRRPGADPRPHGHDRDRRRLQGLADARRPDHGATRRARERRRLDRRGWAVGRSGARRAIRASRCPRGVGRDVRQPGHAPARASRRSPACPGAVSRAHTEPGSEPSASSVASAAPAYSGSARAGACSRRIPCTRAFAGADAVAGEPCACRSHHRRRADGDARAHAADKCWRGPGPHGGSAHNLTSGHIPCLRPGRRRHAGGDEREPVDARCPSSLPHERASGPSDTTRRECSGEYGRQPWGSRRGSGSAPRRLRDASDSVESDRRGCRVSRVDEHVAAKRAFPRAPGDPARRRVCADGGSCAPHAPQERAGRESATTYH